MPHGNTKTYAETLLALARETMTNYELALQAHQAGQIRQLAAATRNLLELSTSSEYCAKSSDNVKRFHEDALRDLLGALQVMDNLAILAPESSVLVQFDLFLGPDVDFYSVSGWRCRIWIVLCPSGSRKTLRDQRSNQCVCSVAR
jgi:hypothetical protein